MITEERIPVISARGCLQGRPASEWKIKCFNDLFKTIKLKEDLVTNLIVIGDSMNEMTAGQRLAKLIKNSCYLKLVKMQEMPQPKEIMK
jgi:hypothetical protein